MLEKLEVDLLYAINRLAKMDPLTNKAEHKAFEELYNECKQTFNENNYLYGNYMKWLNAKLKRKTVSKCY